MVVLLPHASIFWTNRGIAFSVATRKATLAQCFSSRKASFPKGDVSPDTFCGNKPMAVQDYSSVKLDDPGANNLLQKSVDNYLKRFKAVVTLRLP
ncbi:hypothetical protein V6N11_007301 [Hibiscus sabdariffa]|uniref:Uncharacterized protein n=1 Tax=Hibiscus sabdariffa TaxID=183260 RepID=A0ABR2RTS6_9ROSI